jgi:DNA anti-recombination protein RmuC
VQDLREMLSPSKDFGKNGQLGRQENGLATATMEAMASGDESSSSGAKRQAPQAATTAPGQADSGRMEAVVDLLFGNHLTEINANMRALEKQVGERVNKAESEMRTRIESLDRHSTGEAESLRGMIEKERAMRDDSVGTLGDRLESAIKRMETRIDTMEAEIERKQELAQKEFNDRVTKATDETRELRKSMEEEIANMKVMLSTRAELSGLFAELSKRLDANTGGSGLG